MRGDVEVYLKNYRLPNNVKLFEELIVEKRVLFPAVLNKIRKGPCDHVFYLEQGEHKIAIPVKAGTRPEFIEKLIVEGLSQLAQLVEGEK